MFLHWTTTKGLTLAAAATAVAAGVAWRGHPPRSATLRPAVALTEIPLLVGVVGASPARVPGRQRRFDIEFETALDTGSEPVSVAVRGAWVETVTSVAGGTGSGTFDVGYVLENAHITGGGVGAVSPADVEGLAHRLARPFYVTYDASGAAVRVYFPKDVEPTVRNLLELVATTSQLVWPRARASEWRTTERDGAGTYWASYQRTGPGELVKHKLQYLEVDGAPRKQGAAPGVQIEASESRFTVDEAGNVTALHAKETTQLELGAPGTKMGIEVSLHLSNEQERDAPELVGALDQHRKELESVPVQTEHADAATLEAEDDVRLVGGSSVDEIIARVRRAKPEDSAMNRLEALVRLKPSTVPKIVSLIKEGEKPTLLASVLGAAGNLEAQGALIDLAHDESLPRASRIDAMTALAQVRHPTVQTTRGLVDLHEISDAKLRRASQLMSGALAHAVSKEHPEAGAAVESALATEYRNTKDEDERSHLLRALGNAGGPAAFRVLAEAIRDPSPRIRADAASSLRIVTDPAADRLLSAAISQDKDGEVRGAAIFAAGVRSIQPFVEVLMDAARKDPAEYVRHAAIALIGAHRDASPKISETLLFVAEHDPKPALRQVAREIAARP